MSIAYSPRSEVLEDVVRSATAKLLFQNIDLIPEIIKLLPNLTSNNDDAGYQETIQNITFPCNITLPENITIPEIVLPENIPDITFPENITLPNINWTIVYTIIKRCINVTPYDRSSELRGIYVEEAQTRKVIAAVEFDDALHGTFYYVHIIILLHYYFLIF